MADDYYALLGVDRGAARAELRRAWRRLALKWHPDRAGDLLPGMLTRVLFRARLALSE